MRALRNYLARRQEERASRPRVTAVIPGHRPRLEVRAIAAQGQPVVFSVWCLRCHRVVGETTDNIETQSIIEEHDDWHTGA
jgi:hypothetical protein